MSRANSGPGGTRHCTIPGLLGSNGPAGRGTPLPMNLHFDCNATTAASEEVVEAMLPWLSRPGANPSATHPAGREAAARCSARGSRSPR